MKYLMFGMISPEMFDFKQENSRKSHPDNFILSDTFKID